MAPKVRNVQVLPVTGNSQSGGHAAFPGVAQDDGGLPGQRTVAESKAANDLVARTATIETRSVRGKREAVERLRNVGPADNRSGQDVHHHNFVLPKTAMERRCETSARMDGQVHREIPQGNLPPDRPQRPLIGQQDRAVRLRPRPCWLRGDVLPLPHGETGREGQQSEQNWQGEFAIHTKSLKRTAYPHFSLILTTMERYTPKGGTSKPTYPSAVAHLICWSLMGQTPPPPHRSLAPAPAPSLPRSWASQPGLTDAGSASRHGRTSATSS